MLQATCNHMPSSHFCLISTHPSHVDGGANSHIAHDKDIFYWYQPGESHVTMADGAKSLAQGHGCVLARFNSDKKVYILYPVYHMPKNEWPMISTPALCMYSGFQCASAHALESLKVIDHSGRHSTFPTHPMERRCHHLDFLRTKFVLPIGPSCSNLGLLLISHRVLPFAAMLTRSQSHLLTDSMRTSAHTSPPGWRFTFRNEHFSGTESVPVSLPHKSFPSLSILDIVSTGLV